MLVHLKRGWFCQGYRFKDRGIHDIPERFKKLLPSDAEIMEAEGQVSEAVAHDPIEPFKNENHPLAGAKKYFGAKKSFEDEKTGKSCSFDAAFKIALNQYINEAEANSVNSWNDLDQSDRKTRVESAAAKLNGE